MTSAALIVHGGAWTIPEEARDACRSACLRACRRGWRVLESGGSALDACEEAIIELEDEPWFDAGIGSHLNRDGRVQLDAILMDGRTLEAGAVAAVERLRNPIRAARRVLEQSPHMMLVGTGVECFAEEQGLELCDPSELVVPRELELWKRQKNASSLETPPEVSLGTVGAVALDARGDVAAGTSTGGTSMKLPGRVGDSSLIGCGCYADNECGAVSTTGHGEPIMKVVLAKAAADLLAQGLEAQAAAEQALLKLSSRGGGKGGIVLVDRTGRLGYAHTTSHLAMAFQTSEHAEPVVRL